MLSDPAASYWLKAALVLAQSRDPVDAADDATFLGSPLIEELAETGGNRTLGAFISIAASLDS